MKYSSYCGIVAVGVLMVIIALVAMLDEKNYRLNPCPNAPHNQTTLSINKTSNESFDSCIDE